MDNEKENKKEDLKNNQEEVSSKEAPSEETPVEEVPAEVANDEAPSEETPVEEVPAEVANDEAPVSENKVNPYAKFLLGKKIGMTSLYDEYGEQFPTTIIEAGPCYVAQIKTDSNDGYNAVQIGYTFDKKANKPKRNHFSKAKCDPMRHLKEFRINPDDQFSLGEKIEVDVFNEGDYVQVTGVSKGRGFAGVMKRHNFAGGRASHGKNSVMRKPGSVGAGADPARIWKGKKMPGRFGGDKATYKNLEVLKIDKENNLLFIKGSVPGSNNRLVSVFI